MGTASSTRTGQHQARISLLLLLVLALSILAGPAFSQGVELPPGGTFEDDDGSAHEGMIEAIVAEGITAGCTPDGRFYCPASPVTRGQMATFLTRAFDVPTTDQDYFSDVVPGSTHADSINRVAAAGIAEGRGDGSFGPEIEVTREQMATFLARALQLPPATDPQFDDISGPHYENIRSIAQAEISQGCNTDGSRFCPKDQVTRGQMATFLGRSLGLTDIVPPPRPDSEVMSPEEVAVAFVEAAVERRDPSPYALDPAIAIRAQETIPDPQGPSSDYYSGPWEVGMWPQAPVPGETPGRCYVPGDILIVCMVQVLRPELDMVDSGTLYSVTVTYWKDPLAAFQGDGATDLTSPLVFDFQGFAG